MNRTITAQDYDRNVLVEGEQFQVDHHYRPLKKVLQRRICYVLDALGIAAGEKILEVGCGVGGVSFHCARAGAYCVGIDYSVESLKLASGLCRRFDHAEKVSFIHGNALKLPFREGCFDKVVAADFIEHITDQEKKLLLDEIRRVVKREGMIVIFTPNAIRERIGNCYRRIRHLLFRERVPVNDLHYGLISASAFIRILRRSGGLRWKLLFVDITRPYLARIPLARRFLALNLLFTITV